jgi:hypothetical protein
MLLPLDSRLGRSRRGDGHTIIDANLDEPGSRAPVIGGSPASRRLSADHASKKSEPPEGSSLL